MSVCSRLSQMLLILSCKAGIPVACFLHSSPCCKINLNENGYVRKNAYKILFLQTKIPYLYWWQPGISVLFRTYRKVYPSVCHVCAWLAHHSSCNTSVLLLFCCSQITIPCFCQILLIPKMYTFASYTIKFQPVSAPPVPRQSKSPLVLLCSFCRLIRTGVPETVPVLCKPGPGSLSICIFLQ